MNGIRSLYGKVAINKEYCGECRQYAFVIDDQLQCCGACVSVEPKKYKRESICGIGKRPYLSVRVRQEIIRSQAGRCLYCDLEFGSSVIRQSRRMTRAFGSSELSPVRFTRIVLRAVIDHMVPYSYMGHHGFKNLAAACHVCNGLKAAKCFQNVEEASAYLAIKKEQKGYL